MYEKDNIKIDIKKALAAGEARVEKMSPWRNTSFCEKHRADYPTKEGCILCELERKRNKA
jgi:hypothetical protein